jgi:myo-inositol catabolism protein IolC
MVDHRASAATRRSTTSYTVEVDKALGAWRHVRFLIEVRDVIDYAVVLLVEEQEQSETVRVYDGAHGVNELHRYTRKDGKQAAEIFYGGTLGMGMRAAIDEIERNYRSIIEGWRNDEH